MKTYTLKPPEWWDGQAGYSVLETPMGRFEVLKSAFRNAWIISLPICMGFVNIKERRTLDAAKAAAWDAYVARVEQALEVHHG